MSSRSSFEAGYSMLSLYMSVIKMLIFLFPFIDHEFMIMYCWNNLSFLIKYNPVCILQFLMKTCLICIRIHKFIISSFALQTKTVKVSNVSLGATEQDIKEFFSFSGDIEHVEMQRSNSPFSPFSGY